MKGFWREFMSGDNSKVNSMAVLAVALAAPVVALSCAAVVYHVFLLRKGLDSPTVSLLLGLLGAATGGLGASLFSKTTWGGFTRGLPEGWKPPPRPGEGKEGK